jgi:hypothetical protein
MGSLFSTDTPDAPRAPKPEELKVQLQQLVQQGVITPAQAETVLLEQSAYSTIDADPRLRAAQLDALTAIEEQAASGGFDARGRANLAEVQSQQATFNRGQQEAIAANARARGVGGSDLEFVQRMIAQQSGADRAASAGVQTAALAEQRRADALRDAANLSGSIRGQDFQQDAAKAEAADAIARFNAANRQDVVNRNVAATNTAQAANLAEKQRVADTNVGIRNEQETRNKRVPLDVFQARMGQFGAESQNAAMEAADKQRLLQFVGNAGSAAAFAFSDERTKTDVHELDSDALLSELTGMTFRYKRPDEHGEGRRAGVMAQDVERVQPSAVSEGPDGVKRVDYGQLGGLLLAALADMNERLRDVEGK